MQGPVPNCRHPHPPAVLQHPAIMKSPHFGHDAATQEAPLELALLPPAQEPAVHVIPLAVQSVQVAPAVPQ
jgi:hypothetical protein